MERAAKRLKQLPFRHSRGWGQLLTVGQGDTGLVAGGLHTVVLDKDGQVWTFGCNDDGSLGRVEEEEECFLPGAKL